MTDLDALTRRFDVLERELSSVRESQSKLERERDEYKRLYLEMMERCRKLERGLLGQKLERLPQEDAQLSLAVLDMMLGERAAAEIEKLAEEKTIKEHTRRSPTGRKPLPEHLPRVDIEVVPDEVKREGTDAFEHIGDDISEVIERRPASVVVARVIKRKYVRLDREEKKGVLMGETPELPIPRGLAGPGMLADTIVRRWDDHLPLHRQERIYERDGIELARSTICGWHEQLAELCSPLVAAMRLDAYEQPYLCIDATGVLVQAPEKCRTGHFWVLVAPERHVLFEYTPEHTSDAVDTVIAGYSGYLVADAHIVYDHLYKSGQVTEVNCWAHCRRYFFKAMGSDPDRAKEALGLIGALFKIERSIATSPKKKRERMRAKHSAPIVERFLSWCDAEWPVLLEDTPIYEGVRYARNQRVGLSRFLRDGQLPIDNNISERELRREAVGRKNWIFVGSDQGGQVNATFTSILASCRMVGVESWSYLRDLLCLLPRWPKHRVLELAPVNWNATRDRDDVRRALEQNPYRALTLAD